MDIGVQFVEDPHPHKLTISLAEIYNIDTPSKLVISIMQNGHWVAMNLFQHRMKFVYQNGFFLLDTSENKYFQIDISNRDFLIRVDAKKKEVNFNADLYGVTDKPGRNE